MHTIAGVAGAESWAVPLIVCQCDVGHGTSPIDAWVEWSLRTVLVQEPDAFDDARTAGVAALQGDARYLAHAGSKLDGR